MSRRWIKSVLVFFLVSIGGSVWIARSTAPTSYELSIYRETPLLVWLLIGIVLAGSMMIVLVSGRRLYRFAFGATATTAMLAVVWMPMIRGYFFFDEFDSMTHWGTLRALSDGSLLLSDLFYPALTGISLVLARVSGQSLRWSLLFTALVIPTLSVIWIVAAARSLDNCANVGGISLACALLFAPLNPLNVILVPHNSTQAIFLAGFPLLATILYLRTGNRRLIVPLSLGLLVLYTFHPQQMLNFLFFFAGLLIMMIFWRRIARTSHQRYARNPWILFLAAGAFATIALLSHSRFQDSFSWVIISIFKSVSAGGVSGRASSLTALDVSLPLLAAKAGAKYLVLGIGMLAALIWRRRQTTIPEIAYVAGLVPIAGMGTVFLSIGSGNQMVRYIGMAVMLSVPLAAVGLARLNDTLSPSEHWSVSASQMAVAVLLLGGIIAAIPTIHHAPYTERYSPHVPEAQYESYGTMLEHASPDATFTHIRSKSYRYYHARYGFDHSEGPTAPFLPPRREGTVPSHFKEVEKEYNEPFYIAITQADVRRDAELYNGFRYSHADISGLADRPEYGRVYDSDQLWVYFNEEEGELK